MAYRSLILPPSTPPKVRGLIHRIEVLSFSDVHSMLRLPLHNYRLGAGCNFAIAHVLMAVIAGVSSTLYRHTGRVGERFTGVLVEYFPWDLESSGSVPPKDAADIIYEVFRNPITHDLGLDLKKKSTGLQIKIKRMKTTAPKNRDRGLTERQIETLEASSSRPHMSAAVTVAAHKKVLFVEALYWGVRRMIERLAADVPRMQSAEKFLASL